MPEWLQRALVWCGFTPTQRETRLQAAMLRAAAIAEESRAQVERVERLIAFRESLGAKMIDVDSLRGALDGSDQSR